LPSPSPEGIPMRLKVRTLLIAVGLSALSLGLL
jgi:hypothetical protein